MYVPAHFAETRIGVLHAMIRQHPLGTFVVDTSAGLEANHIPFIVDPTPANGTLRAHVAKANPVWQSLSSVREALVVFQGADAYVSPSAYESKRQDGKVVPTWNYIAVHAYGKPHVVSDPQWLRKLIEELTFTHESGRPEPWQVSDAPGEYIDKLINAIVGIEIPIDRLVGKWKVSQNRSAADRAGVAADVRESAAEMSNIIASLNQA
jgi:transcriptional regulator